MAQTTVDTHRSSGDGAMDDEPSEKLFVDCRASSEKESPSWSRNHLRMLYLLSKFAMFPNFNDDEESWLRNLPLLVLVYEVIVIGILDYDYSPVCTNIVKNGQSKRIWMNISQDAKAAIDDLRDHGLVKALKTCSEDFQPSTAFQITPQALTVLETFPKSEKKRIDTFLLNTVDKSVLHSANSSMVMFDSSLLKIMFDTADGKFRLLRNDGSEFVSRITDIEEVSCKQDVNAIKDELSFAILLSNVRVMVGDFTNFEADIQTPNDDGIVQIESFGMHLNGDGTIVYGMFIDAIMDQAADSICVDHLSRLLVDVDLDSSKIIDDLLSPHQRGLMSMLFMKDSTSRSKFNLITAKEILPKLPVCEYLDRGEKENELKQILGEIHAVYDLSEDDKILVGRDGMLLVGPNCNQHEPLIVSYLALLSKELFIRFFFKRTFILDDMLNRARAYMKNFEMNPEALNSMRTKVDQCSHDLVILEEILELLRESMRAMQLPSCPTDTSGKLLYDRLQLRKTHTDLEIRCKDLAKLLRGFRAKLKQVQSQNSNMAKTLLETIVHSIERNLGVVAEGMRATERSMATPSDVVLTIFTGFLAFETIDRVTDGELLGIDGKFTASLEWANDILVQHIIIHPGLWFVLDLAWMLLIACFFNFGISFIISHLTKMHTVSFTLCKRINVAALENFIQTHKLVESRSANFNSETKIVKVVWRDHQGQWRKRIPTWEKGVGIKWNFGAILRTQITFDLANNFLLEITFHVRVATGYESSWKNWWVA
ncbi:hypothetical protein FI667_g12271, partial [Globisporangium splendens]